MINIKILELDKYKDATKYEVIENGIFKDVVDSDDTNHRIAFSFELEQGEDTQYPIEDVLDKFYLYVSDFLESEDPSKILNLELAGELEHIREVISILGKRVYNQDYVDEKGKTRVKLIIE